MAAPAPVSIRGDVTCIAASKLYAACAVAGLDVTCITEARSLDINVVGVQFDEKTVNIAAALVVASAAAACATDGKHPSPVADAELEELLSWEIEHIAPHLITLVEFGKKQGAGAGACWAAFSKSALTKDGEALAPAATAYSALLVGLADIEARLSVCGGKLFYAGCSPSATNVAAAVFGAEFCALVCGPAAFPLSSVAPVFSAWLSSNAWSLTWFPTALCSVAGGASTPTPVAGADSATVGGKKKNTAGKGGTASAVTTTKGDATPAPVIKPAKFDKAAAKAALGGAAGLLAAVCDAPLAPIHGASLSDADLRAPLLSALSDAFTVAIAAAFPAAAEKGISRADVTLVTQVRQQTSSTPHIPRPL
jgi:hypothetical protein